jgi:hypothetical protein
MLRRGNEGIVAGAADWLFWFAGGPEDQYIVHAASIDEAERKMADRGLSYDRCGLVRGPGDGRPPGIWKDIDDAT